jgi:hypothetical protein
MIALLIALSLQDDLDREVEMLKRRLELSDEQAAKVRELLKESREKIKSLLNDDQKRRFDEPRGEGRGGRMMMGGMPSGRDLKEPLGLTDEQVEKADKILQEMGDEIRNYWQKRREGGEGGDPGEDMRKFRDKGVEKLKGILTDEQKEKLDKLMQERGWGGGGREERPVGERVKEVMDALKVADAGEADAVKAAVTKVIEAQRKAQTVQRESRQQIEELARNTELSDEGIESRLGQIRDARKKAQADVREAQKALREIVSYRQEVTLMRMGILD